MNAWSANLGSIVLPNGTLLEFLTDPHDSSRQRLRATEFNGDGARGPSVVYYIGRQGGIVLTHHFDADGYLLDVGGNQQGVVDSRGNVVRSVAADKALRERDARLAGEREVARVEAEANDPERLLDPPASATAPHLMAAPPDVAPQRPAVVIPPPLVNPGLPEFTSPLTGAEAQEIKSRTGVNIPVAGPTMGQPGGAALHPDPGQPAPPYVPNPAPTETEYSRLYYPDGTRRPTTVPAPARP